jgi:hypothetical protein
MMSLNNHSQMIMKARSEKRRKRNKKRRKKIKRRKKGLRETVMMTV